MKIDLAFDTLMNNILTKGEELEQKARKKLKQFKHNEPEAYVFATCFCRGFVIGCVTRTLLGPAGVVVGMPIAFIDGMVTGERLLKEIEAEKREEHVRNDFERHFASVN